MADEGPEAHEAREAMMALEQVPGTAESLNRLTGEYVAATGIIPPGLKEPAIAAANLLSNAIGILNPGNLLDAFGSEDEQQTTIIRRIIRRPSAVAATAQAIRGVPVVWLVGGLLGIGLIVYLVTQ